MATLSLMSLQFSMDDFTTGLIGFIVLFLISGIMTAYKVIEAKNNAKSVLKAIIPFIFAEAILTIGFLLWFLKSI